jgi:hypothetical protein
MGPKRGVAESMASPRNVIFPLMGGVQTPNSPPWLRSCVLILKRETPPPKREAWGGQPSRSTLRTPLDKGDLFHICLLVFFFFFFHVNCIFFFFMHVGQNNKNI